MQPSDQEQQPTKTEIKRKKLNAEKFLIPGKRLVAANHKKPTASTPGTTARARSHQERPGTPRRVKRHIVPGTDVNELRESVKA